MYSVRPSATLLVVASQALHFLSLTNAIIAYAVYLLVRSLYRLSPLHPLWKFPGPMAAKVTVLYQAYYEVGKDGGWVEHIGKLHEVHGPILRTRPNELHFSSPSAYFDIYANYISFKKDEEFYKCFGEDETSFGFIDKSDHKRRRDVLNPLFSRKAIQAVETLVQDKVDLFIERLLADYAPTQAPANIMRGLRCVTLDIVTAYCYATSFDALASPHFGHPILLSMEAAIPIMITTKHFPFLMYMNGLPDAIVEWMSPNIAGLLQLRAFLRKQVDDVVDNPSVLGRGELAGHDTIYHHLLGLAESSQKKGNQWVVPSKKSLVEEAQAFLFAGTDTTSNAMIIGFFHVLNNPSILERFQSELSVAWPDPGIKRSWEELEKCEYLTGIIKESLRLSLGVPTPLPRVAEYSVIVDGVRIPRGTVVSSGVSFVLLNPEIFPEPERFNPDRWAGEKGKGLDKYLVVFSKGPRQCVAMNLAWAELYLMFAYTFRMVNMELDKTSRKDISFRYHTVPVWRGRPLKILVKGEHV